MKKLVLSLLFASSLAYGQQIQNGDFENWSTSPGANYPSPTGYLGAAFGSDGITQVAGYQGGSAVRLSNVEIFPFDTLPSMLLGGYFTPNGLPSKISGYYRCDMKGIDSASILLIVGDKRKALEQEDASAYAYMAFGGVQPNWTYFEASIMVITNDPIDTGSVIMSSDAIMGNSDLHEIIQPDSYIEFDKLTVSYRPTGLFGTTNNATSIKLYPNPASQSVTLENVDGLRDYTILDLAGATLLKGKLHLGSNTIDLSTVAQGTYQLVSRSDSRTFGSKLVVK